MNVVTHDRFSKPTRIRATRVVIEDDYGNPIGVFVQVEPNHVIAEIADNEEKFNALLRNLGINKTLVVDKLSPPPPPEDRFGFS
jgi:ribosomal protein L16/L10AE